MGKNLPARESIRQIPISTHTNQISRRIGSADSPGSSWRQ